MKTYRVPVVWQMYGYVEVQAETHNAAVNAAMDAPLPTDGSYIEGSFEIDEGSFCFVDGEEN